jgi:hypothetical protein
LNNDYHDRYLSREEYNSIVEIYKKIARDLDVEDYHDLVKIIKTRYDRNSQQYDAISNFISICQRRSQRPNFTELLNEFNLNVLIGNRQSELKTLERIFNYFLEHNEYR